MSDSSRPQDDESPDPLPESLLVEQAKADPSAFGVLYERHVDRIYAYIAQRVGNSLDAEDLTARTFFRALSRLHTYEDRGLPFTAWLYRIAHNLVANFHRDNSRRRFIPLDKLWLPGRRRSSEPDAIIEAESEHEALWAAIQRLSQDRQDLLLYKFSSRLSNMEIGAILGRSEGAVKSLYFRTLAALRQDLQARGWRREEPENLSTEKSDREQDDVSTSDVSASDIAEVTAAEDAQIDRPEIDREEMEAPPAGDEET